MLAVFFTGLWLGFVFNVAPGAVFTESLRRGISGGFRPAFSVQIGSLVGDALWAVLGLAGAAAVLSQPHLTIPLTLVGCGVLILLGVQGLRAAFGTTPPVNADNPSSRHRSAILAGAAMSIGNVWNVVYWGGAGGAVAGSVGTSDPVFATGVFFAAFMLSSIIWCFVCAGIVAGLRRALKPRLIRVIEICSAVALIVMAIVLAASALADR